MADMMDKTVSSIMTAFVAVVLVCSAFIPTVVPMITKLGTSDSTGGADAAQFKSLLLVVVTMTIIGVVIGVIYSFRLRESAER